MSDAEDDPLVPIGKAVHYGSLEAGEQVRQMKESSSHDAVSMAKEAGNINMSAGNGLVGQSDDDCNFYACNSVIIVK